MSEIMHVAHDSRELRRILGHYPTGVSVVTTILNGAPIGMVVGSFTSVSLQPPLVAFFPSRDSGSWAQIEKTGRFCVNVLSEHQHGVCRAIFEKKEDKFSGLPYRPSPGGQPILAGVVAWIDCVLDAVHEAGDHAIALGQVEALAIEHPHRPLLFLQGEYGQFAPIPSVKG